MSDVKVFAKKFFSKSFCKSFTSDGAKNFYRNVFVKLFHNNFYLYENRTLLYFWQKFFGIEPCYWSGFKLFMSHHGYSSHVGKFLVYEPMSDVNVFGKKFL